MSARTASRVASIPVLDVAAAPGGDAVEDHRAQITTRVGAAVVAAFQTIPEEERPGWPIQLGFAQLGAHGCGPAVRPGGQRALISSATLEAAAVRRLLRNLLGGSAVMPTMPEEIKQNELPTRQQQSTRG